MSCAQKGASDGGLDTHISFFNFELAIWKEMSRIMGGS